MRELPSGPRVRALARTYGIEGPERVEEYRRVMEFAAEHSGKGSSAIASSLGLPRGRIRPWLEGSTAPEPVRAIETADRLGWFETDPDAGHCRAMVRCHAWILAGGAIAEATYRPTFAVGDGDPISQLRSDLETLGLEYHRYRSEVDHRGTELCPAKNGVLLGRFLAGCLNAPVGAKNESAPERVPFWLQHASRNIKRNWAQTYASVRGVVRDDREDALQLCERRSEGYLETLTDTLRAAVDRPAAIHQFGASTVYVDQPAAGALTI